MVQVCAVVKDSSFWETGIVLIWCSDYLMICTTSERNINLLTTALHCTNECFSSDYKNFKKLNTKIKNKYVLNKLYLYIKANKLFPLFHPFFSFFFFHFSLYNLILKSSLCLLGVNICSRLFTVCKVYFNTFLKVWLLDIGGYGCSTWFFPYLWERTEIF